jgi:hypothetical protein
VRPCHRSIWEFEKRVFFREVQYIQFDAHKFRITFKGAKKVKDVRKVSSKWNSLKCPLLLSLGTTEMISPNSKPKKSHTSPYATTLTPHLDLTTAYPDRFGSGLQNFPKTSTPCVRICTSLQLINGSAARSRLDDHVRFWDWDFKRFVLQGCQSSAGSAHGEAIRLGCRVTKSVGYGFVVLQEKWRFWWRKIRGKYLHNESSKYIHEATPPSTTHFHRCIINSYLWLRMSSIGNNKGSDKRKHMGWHRPKVQYNMALDHRIGPKGQRAQLRSN